MYNHHSVDGNYPETREVIETAELTAPIFNESGEEIAKGSIVVEYTESNGTAYISSMSKDEMIHSDDLHAALREEFKSYEI